MRAGLQRTNIQNSIFTTKMDVFESEIPIAMTLKNLRVRKAIDATSYSLFDKDYAPLLDVTSLGRLTKPSHLELK